MSTKQIISIASAAGEGTIAVNALKGLLEGFNGVEVVVTDVTDDYWSALARVKVLEAAMVQIATVTDPLKELEYGFRVGYVRRLTEEAMSDDR